MLGNLSVYPRQASDMRQSSYLNLSNVGTIDMFHHTGYGVCFNTQKRVCQQQLPGPRRGKSCPRRVSHWCGQASPDHRLDFSRDVSFG